MKKLFICAMFIIAVPLYAQIYTEKFDTVFQHISYTDATTFFSK